jgi:hypothetical protein
LWLLATFFLWFVLAIYFDNVLPDVNGVRKSWFYFLSISYWTGKGTKQKEGECLMYHLLLAIMHMCF